MGRQKIPMEKIESEAALQVSFSKRRFGVFKKANELATLCGALVALIVFSPSGRLYSIGFPCVDTVLDLFLNNNLPSGFLMQGVSPMSDELNIELMEVSSLYEQQHSQKISIGNELKKASENIDLHHSISGLTFDGNSLQRLELLQRQLMEVKQRLNHRKYQLDLAEAAATPDDPQLSPNEPMPIPAIHSYLGFHQLRLNKNFNPFTPVQTHQSQTPSLHQQQNQQRIKKTNTNYQKQKQMQQPNLNEQKEIQQPYLNYQQQIQQTNLNNQRQTSLNYQQLIMQPNLNYQQQQQQLIMQPNLNYQQQQLPIMQLNLISKQQPIMQPYLNHQQQQIMQPNLNYQQQQQPIMQLILNSKQQTIMQPNLNYQQQQQLIKQTNLIYQQQQEYQEYQEYQQYQNPGSEFANMDSLEFAINTNFYGKSSNEAGPSKINNVDDNTVNNAARPPSASADLRPLPISFATGDVAEDYMTEILLNDDEDAIREPIDAEVLRRYEESLMARPDSPNDLETYFTDLDRDSEHLGIQIQGDKTNNDDHHH